MIERLCVIGVGLIGGSIAKAARERGLCREIVGVDADAENLRKAVDLGIIDTAFAVKGAGDAARGAEGADWVVVATPVWEFPWAFKELRPIWSSHAVYTDVGSTKCSVIAAAEREFGSVPPNFVPGHPIAGAERSGVGAAMDDLFRGRRVILTPVRETSADALRRVEDFWMAVGARVSLMEPGHHDQVFAATSHLPHVLAYALVHMLGRKDEQEEIFQYAGAGFRDFTRIASSNPQMWRDICLLNSGQIVPLIDSLGDELKQVAALMKNCSGEELLAYFAEARDARQRYLDQSSGVPY